MSTIRSKQSSLLGMFSVITLMGILITVGMEFGQGWLLWFLSTVATIFFLRIGCRWVIYGDGKNRENKMLIAIGFFISPVTFFFSFG